ncbi:Serine-threonine/tyrosine-protein kinase, catalytic domain [Dillenia turbinata]|uniref:Serine-threonine/tyrosine-protein kinase, catalytic domain n=1 Tax=Dillenia turbinata TaxID=194707 RepID=A0AAN8URE6_9MAGN
MEGFVLVIRFTFMFWFRNVGGSFSLLSPKGVNFEVAALMAVKRELRDKYNVLDGWVINSVDPCTWNMVSCTSDGFVISLDMANMGLSGTLSPGIGNLSHVQSMLLQNNQLTGPVPAEIGRLSELETLDLSGNQIVGEIPSTLGYLTHLSYLWLSKNKFTGQIPGPVANLSSLSFLDLSFNNLSGPTPKILAKGYSVTGNTFLCNSSSTGICISTSSPEVGNLRATCRSSSYLIVVIPKYIYSLAGTNSTVKVSNHHRWVVVVIIGISCTFVVSMTLLVCWVHWYRSRFLYNSYGQQDYEFEIGHLKRFTFRELQIATSNFSPRNILGHGGFGVVYQGCLPNRMVVAVKRLKDPNFTGEVQFQTEVEMIGLALHRNLLRLYGFCMTSNERLLVYPYMPNGSVAERLRDTCRDKPSLDWTRRMHIAIGAARGLLDSHVTTAVRATIGHIAPEYLSTGQSSEKTDVFGFGILLLELITGQKALDAGNGQIQKGMILDWVRTLHEEKRLEVLVDRDLKGCFDAEELEKAVELALLCTQSLPNLRPMMSDILKVLEGIVGQSAHAEEPLNWPL